MGWLQMSKQELRRVEVLTEVLAGQLTTESAAGVLGVSLRQAQRLVRDPDTDVDLDATSRLGWGVSLWIAATDADALHAEFVEKGVPIVLPPADGPFGRFFSFRDPDGYAITVNTEGQAAGAA